MAVTVEELYAWLLVNWERKLTYKSVESLPAAGSTDTLYYATTDKSFAYWNGSEFVGLGGLMLDEYTDDTAAKADGLVAGQLYNKTGIGIVSVLPTVLHKLPFIFDSENDTPSAQISIKGKITVVDLVKDSKLTSVTYEVKTTASTTWTAAVDQTALNSWITSNVTTSTVVWQIRAIANYGTNSGEADASIIYTL